MTPRGEARRAMIITLTFDVVSAMAAMVIALTIRWVATGGAPVDFVTTGLVATSVFGLSALFSFYQLGVHKQVWRHSGWPDAVRVVQAVGLTVLIFLPILFLWNRLVGFPRSSIAIAIGVWLVFLFFGRMIALFRSTRQPFQIFSAVRKDAPLTVLIANAEQAAAVLKDMSASSRGAPVRVLGVLETDGAEPGRAIRGVPILGDLDDLGKVLGLLSVRYGIMPWVAVTGETRDREFMSRILAEASAQGAKVMALGRERDGGRLKPVRPSDLLARPPRVLDPLPVANLLKDKRVFVTGAGGTIGSELVMQCAKARVSHLTAFDASEYNLYSIDLKLREYDPTLETTIRLGDVRDRQRLVQAVERDRPDVLIHAAALKHVPLMEMNACEAILTNVGGALNAVEAAISADVSRFVFISTDKAVDPDNVMGATKRLAELVVKQKARGTNLAASMVRFGNVLGSSGSVVPLFERQIAAGGPVTLTDDEVSRYFMSVEEATSLVLQGAANNGAPGEASLFVLDMGEPIRIRALAEAMIRMKGLLPNHDIKIQTTGLRPGEKLHEELTYDDERLQETGVEGLRKVLPSARQAEPYDFERRLKTLLEVAAQRDRVNALKLLSELVPQYRPPNCG
ncbi:MAG: nucleoside-diphosphate sugar epimerase/dehydratase [Henriciella sp.]|nr:nucleoside-diphosphate sugar epimerase/dehydratase [Henriciella sp.]